MSSKCIVTIKNENWLKREIVLYQHTEGHPNNMMISLVSDIRDIYQEFKEHGDSDWFLDPGKLAGMLIVRSVPLLTDEMKSLLKSLPPSSKNRLESSFFLGLPNMLPESKVYDVNYEYSILLKESNEKNFLGYQLEIYKIQNNKRASLITSQEENFIREMKLIPTNQESE